MANLPDKLPSLDPNERGIFDRIVEAAQLERKRRRSDEFMQVEKRREESLANLHKLREREARSSESERLEVELAAMLEPTFIAFQSLSLRRK